MRQCDNGHYYDEVRFSSCPYCSGGGVGKTVAAAPSADSNDIGKTVGVYANMGASSPSAPSASSGGSDAGKTVAVFKKAIGIDPPVGFLVCVGGVHRGMSYRIVSGRNFIGRSSSMDISLPDDKAVSRESHAIVSYDAKHNSFSVSAGQGRGITYLNGDSVEVSEKLNAYDIIEVGDSKLLFLPLCCDKFTWDDDEDKKND